MGLRLEYLAAALLLLGLEVTIAWRLHDRLIRPYAGDSLAVALVYCALRALVPLLTASAVLISLTAAFGIEAAQYYHLVEVVGLGDCTAARVSLGTSYDPRDLVAYVFGAALVIIVEAVRRRMAADWGLT